MLGTSATSGKSGAGKRVSGVFFLAFLPFFGGGGWGGGGGKGGRVTRPYLSVAVFGASLQVLADALPVPDELPDLWQHPGP